MTRRKPMTWRRRPPSRKKSIAKLSGKGLNECWHDKKEAYDVAEKATKQEEIDRKAEWKGLKRMLCIIDAFTDSKVTSDEIKKCKDKTHDTSHLAISYPVIKPMGACKVPEGYPSTGAYKK